MAENSPETIRFDGYDQPQKIGEGGMASVWKARQISLDRWVAIKVLFPDQCTTDEEIDRFQSEARIAARMNHPNIVQVYDAFYRNDRFCFVMEHVDGYTVGSWIRTAVRISQQQCLFVAAGVADALAYAWNKQMLVHCDLKPENIMVDSDGMIKVTDFGLSRSILSLQSRRIRNENDFVFGTPAYISPEQAMGASGISIHSDMYSLGATLFHMATGKKLFNEMGPDSMMNAQVNSQYEDPFSMNPELSPFFCDFLERLLCKKPADRYGSWDDVIGEISNLRAGVPLKHGAINPSRVHSSVACSPARTAARAKILKERAGKASATAIASGASPAIPMAVRVVNSAPRGTIPISSDSLGTGLHTTAQSQRGGTADVPKSRLERIHKIAIAAVSICLLAAISAGAVMSHKAKCQRTEKYARAELMDIEHDFRVRPYEFTATIRRYDELLAKLSGSPHAVLRQEMLERRDRIAKERTVQIDKVMNDLRESVAPFVEAKQYAKAANIVNSYTGMLSAETRRERAKLAEVYHQQAVQLRRSGKN